MALKPVVLLAVANEWRSHERHLPNLQLEKRIIREIFQRPGPEGLCDLVVCEGARAQDIIGAFQDPRLRDRIAVFHFAGHAKQHELFFESGSGDLVGADIRLLAAFLREQRNLHLVFLNGCSTRQQVQRLLLEAKVPAVIATRDDIEDEAAVGFARTFYQAFAHGCTLQRSFNEAVPGAALDSDRRRRGDSSTVISVDCPWELYVGPGAGQVRQWGLAAVVDSPLYGLPPVPHGDLPLSPFRSLDAFRAEDAEVFFGRGRDIRVLYDHIKDPEAAPIQLVYGASGVGKSSLLAAGLIPRLGSDYSVGYLTRDPNLGLLGTCLSCFPGVTSPEDLGAAWRRRESATPGRPFVLVLDQVEQVFTRPTADREGELRTFFHSLHLAFSDRSSRPSGKLVLSFRKEWLTEIEERLRDLRIVHVKVPVLRLDAPGVKEAVVGPATAERLQKQYGLEVETGLAERIAEDLLRDADSAVGPVLQILLTRMWERAHELNEHRPRFTHGLYSEIRDGGIALGDFLDQQTERIRQWRAEVVESGFLLDLLHRHTTLLGGQAFAAQRSLNDLCRDYAHRREELAAVLQMCQDLYLLQIVTATGQGATGERAMRLTHDALAPLVVDRYQTSARPAQKARRVIEHRVAEWTGGRVGARMDEGDLRVFRAGRNAMRGIDSDESRLIAASERSSRHRSRWNRAIRSTLVILVLAVVVAGLYNMSLREQAELERDRLLAREYYLRAVQHEKDGQTRSALAYAIESLRYRADPAVIEFAGCLRHRQGFVVWCSPNMASQHDPARAVAWAQNDQWIAAAEGTLVCLIDANTGEQLKALEGHTQDVTSVAFSPDGQRVISGASDNTIRLWDANKGEQLKVLEGHTQVVASVAFSPDGQRVVSGSYDRTIRFWDANTGEQLLAVMGTTGGVTSVAFSPDGQRVVSGSRDHTIRLWDANNGEELQRLDGDTGPVYAVAFSPDGQRFVSGAEDNMIRLWDANTGAQLKTLEGHTGSVTSVTFSPDGQRVVSGSLDQTIRLWDANAGEQLKALEGHSGDVTSVAFSPDGQRVVSGSNDRTIRLWDANTGEQLMPLKGHTGRVRAVAFSPDGQRVVSGSYDRTIRLWDANTGEQLKVLEGHTGYVDAVAFNPDGQRIVSGADDNTIRLWDAATGAPLGVPLEGHTAGVTSVAFSPDGQRIVSGSNDRTIRLWDANTGEHLLAVMGIPGGVTSVAFSPDGQRVASAGENSVRLWDANTGKEFRVLVGFLYPNTSVAFSPDGQWVVSGSGFGPIRLWNVNTGEELRPLEGHTRRVASVAFSPDGQRVASAGENSVRLWDANTGKQLKALEGHTKDVTSVAFSPDGQRVVSGSSDQTIRLWDANTGEQLVPLRGRAGHVDAVAFSPDGRRIVSGGWQYLLWDANTGEQLKVLEGHTESVYSVAFSPDGQRVVSGSRDNTIRFWDANTGEQLDEFVVTSRLSIISVCFALDGKNLIVQTKSGLFCLDLATGKLESPRSPEEEASWATRLAYQVHRPEGLWNGEAAVMREEVEWWVAWIATNATGDEKPNRDVLEILDCWQRGIGVKVNRAGELESVPVPGSAYEDTPLAKFCQ